MNAFWHATTDHAHNWKDVAPECTGAVAQKQKCKCGTTRYTAEPQSATESGPRWQYGYSATKTDATQ